ncbi:hypothetical protein Agub_g15298 [Astrephomene gubernaculifera]|uniref:Uncharacterized protein n=1 Tax=Astrephomene gubernaculifera TaxID=47775 RepID=A0AAD3E592_9CHLO|nr:hypothetical protein Agub_g15298 [Astrephomene gubernaculifera]
MATAAHIPTAALNETFKKELFSKEVEGWIGRATPADRERFERVFESIRSISESKKVPDAHAGFVNATLDKFKKRGGSASAAANNGTRTPTLIRGASAVAANGWSYTATRAALGRAETQAALATLQQQVALEQEKFQKQQQRFLEGDVDRPQSAPGGVNGHDAAATTAAATAGGTSTTTGRDRELLSIENAAVRRRAASMGSHSRSMPGINSSALDSVGGGPAVVTSATSSTAATAGSATAAAATNVAALAAATAAATLGYPAPTVNPPAATHSAAAAAVAAAVAAATAANSAGAAGPKPPVATGSSGGARPDKGFVPFPPHVTNYQESYNLRSCYPEVYNQALEDTKIEPVPNSTFISEWGDSLKAHADEAAKLYMRTTYNTVNDEVVRPRTEADATREREFFKWMRRQKSYFGDLLTKAKAQDLDSILEVADDEQKRDILEAFRMLHAVAEPCFDRTRSHSQAVHCPMSRMDDGLDAKMALNTKLRTMGAVDSMRRVGGGGGGAGRRPATAMGAAELKPNKVNLTLGGTDEGAEDGGGGGGAKALKPSRRPATAGAALSRASKGPQPIFEKTNVFKNKAPLTWPHGRTGPEISHYTETFGGGKIGVDRARPNSAMYKASPIKYVDASCPYGMVNPYTAAAPLRAAYPVPAGFVAPATAIFPQPKGDTVYRNEFAPRDTADLLVQLRAAANLAENQRKMLDRGSIPMGPRTGVNLVPSSTWISEAKDSYVQYEVNLRDPHERAQAMRTMFSGPTASAGKMTAAVPVLDKNKANKE